MKKLNLLVPFTLFVLTACVSASDPAVSDYRRGLAAYSAGLTERAIMFYTSAINRGTLRNNEQAVAFESRCRANIALGVYDLALSDCSEAIALDQSLAEAYDGRCWAQLRIEQLTLAVSDCEKAVEMNRDEKSFAHNLGFVYENLGEIDKAKTEYQRALALDPTFVEAQQGLNRLGAL